MYGEAGLKRPIKKITREKVINKIIEVDTKGHMQNNWNKLNN